MRKYVKDHKAIIDRLNKELDECGCSCVKVRDLANALHKDVRTVQSHLEIATQYGTGDFLDNNREIFCSKEGITQLYERMKEDD